MTGRRCPECSRQFAGAWFYSGVCIGCHRARVRAKSRELYWRNQAAREPLFETDLRTYPDLHYCRPLGIPPLCDEFERQRIAGGMRG